MKLPRLSHLMGGYFHQDYDLNGDDDTAILSEFAQVERESDVKATVEELDHLLDTPVEGLLARFNNETKNSGMMIGQNDTEAVLWLRHARSMLAANLESGLDR